MTGADCILDFLVRHQCDTVFGYPGGAIMPLYDALLDHGVTHYLARHEQGAGFAAIGYARSTNRPGVCFCTSGPGVTNLLTPIADALLDSVPLLLITGQVASTTMGTDAFQEIDSLGLSLGVTKHSYQVTDVEHIPHVMKEAFELCRSGRPGPVLIDVPKDILTTKMPQSHCITDDCSYAPVTKRALPEADIERANRLLAGSHRPLIYVGGGIAMADALEPVREYMQRAGLPVVSSLKGLGTTPRGYDLDLGMLGMHGLKAANLAVSECDLLLVLGARLDDRATGKLSTFAPDATLIHVDIDPSELGKRRRPAVGIHANIAEVMLRLCDKFEVADWLDRVQTLRGASVDPGSADSSTLSAHVILKRLNTLGTENTIFTCDVGQHQMWAAQNLIFNSPRHHLTSGGLGTMGFGLPAAIGAQVAHANATVINISGDGSFMMNLQELATVNRYSLPIKIVLFDNQRLGMVKQWQELFHRGRFSETDLSDNPPFTEIAKSFGLRADELVNRTETDEKLRWLLNCDGPCLLHVKLNPEDNVWPIVPPNKGNHEMMEKGNV